MVIKCIFDSGEAKLKISFLFFVGFPHPAPAEEKEIRHLQAVDFFKINVIMILATTISEVERIVLKKEKKKNSLRWLIPASLTVGAILWWMIAHAYYYGKPLDETTYGKAKSALTTTGTHIRTLILRSGDGRTVSGTLIQNSDVKIVITAGHYFANTHQSTTYWYVLNGRTNYISRVFSHPRPGPLGPRDIAFCASGRRTTIRGYFATKRDTSYSDLVVSPCTPFQVTMLQGNIPLTVLGMLFRNPENPLYMAKYTTRDGESGSGLMSKGKFFVVSGNIQVSTTDFFPILGVSNKEITLITEL